MAGALDHPRIPGLTPLLLLVTLRNECASIAISRVTSSPSVPLLREKNNLRRSTPFPIGFIHTKPHHQQDVVDENDEDFKPFFTQGSVSLEGVDKPVPITILQDTGAKQSHV